MGDDALQLGFLRLRRGGIKQILCHLALQLDCQVGVVDIEESRNRTLFVFSVEFDVMIGIAIVVKLTNRTVNLDIWFLVFGPLSAEA